jgi:autotransporter-associated beta strand protein
MLALNFNNILGNNFGDPAKLPEIIVNETIVSATNYNLVGDVTLNAGTLSQSTTNAGAYQGYQFRGDIKVRGTVGLSVITGSGGNHLSPNTVFDVEDVTGDSAEDLNVSTPLINPSGDFASTPVGGLTKIGAGTMLISAASSYTGSTVVSEGVLSIQSASLSDTGKLNVADGAVIDLNFVGSDTVDSLVLGGANQPAGTYGAVGSGAEFETPRITGTGLIIAGEPDPFVEWIASYPSLTGPNTARDADPDGDGLTNIQEFAFNSAPDNGGASGKMRSAVSAVGANQALVLTLPVRDGAVFAIGAPASATLPDEQITYQISGTNDLATFDQSVSEVIPSLSSGLPALDAGWSYRTFRLDGNVGGATPRGPMGFLRAAIVDDAP